MRATTIRLFTKSLAWSLIFVNSALAQWQLTDAIGRKLDTDQPVVLTDGYAVIGINNSTMGIYDIASGRLIRNILLPNGPAIGRRTFAADDGMLLVSDSVVAPNAILGHSRAYSFDIATGRQLAELDLPSPTRRVAQGRTLATDGELGVLSSFMCMEPCETDAVLRGVVDVFDLETGAHLHGIVHTDESNFGAALDIDQNVVAVSSSAHNPDAAVPGNVHLYDAISGDRLNTIVPTGTSESRRKFGADLAIENGRLVVGDEAFSTPNSNQQGSVSVFNVGSGSSIAEFTMDQLDLAGTGLFGHAVDVSGDYLIAGAPASRRNALAANEMQAAATSAEGAVVIANFTAGPEAILSLETWSGGDSVAIAGQHALVRSTSNDQTSIYAISLVGLLPSVAAVSPATLQTFGDLDGDGSVAFPDFLVFSDNFGANVDGVGHGDLNSNGIVDFPDFLILSDNYTGIAIGSQAVPEPEIGWLGFLEFAFVCSFVTRRKRREA